MLYHLTSKIVFSDKDLRFLPSVGDLVSVKFYDRISGRITNFRLFSCFGLCIARIRKGILSSFIIRNSFHKNTLELKFLLYSPLLFRCSLYDFKRKRYKKSKLYYLRLKKISYSKIRL